MLNLDHSDRNCINNWIPRNTAFGIVRRRCSKIAPAVAIGPRLNNHPRQYCTSPIPPFPEFPKSLLKRSEEAISEKMEGKVEVVF